MKFIALFLALLLGVPSILAQNEPSIRIVATTTQAADLVTILGGDLIGETIEVTALMGAGVDPHLYRPTESDIAAMNRADAIIYSGLHLEGQFDTVFNALAERGVRIYAMSDPVKAAGYTFGGFTLSEELVDVDDPHFWFDPRNWQLTAEGAAAFLSELLPEHAELFAANYEAYYEHLDLLYAWGNEAMSVVPEEQRVLVTSHDAFQYFGDAFGWEVRGLQGISTEDEAGVADIQDIADFVVEREIPVMFVESSVPPDAIEAVREAVQSGGGQVDIGLKELYSDAMGAPGDFGGTYIGMIAQNVAIVVRSFGYELPEWPEVLEPVLPESLIMLGEEVQP
jgi:manganese/zinc/iron transport system substrate-binding protein